MKNCSACLSNKTDGECISSAVCGVFKSTTYIIVLLLLLQPMHDDYDLRQEQLNKASLLSSKKFLESLLDKFISNVVHC